MTRYATPVHLLAPRSLVPNELKNSYVGNLDEQGALAIAYLVKRRLNSLKNEPRRYVRVVIVDIDQRVYAVRPESASVDLLSIMHPELFCGTYTVDADVGDVAADLESMRRMV